MRAAVLALLTLLFIASAMGSAEAITPDSATDAEGMKYYWAKTYGSSYNDEFRAIALTPEGDVLVAGFWNSSWVTNVYYLWLVALDERGDVEWAYKYQLLSNEVAEAIAIAPDGDIIVLGNVLIWPFSYFWVIKIDGTTHEVEWENIYGPGSPRDVAVADDGSIYVVGYTDAYGAGNSDIWALKLRGDDGSREWQKTYGSTDTDVGYAIALTDDGFAIVVGETYSFGAGGSDMVVLKIDIDDGSVEWCRVYGGASDEGGRDVVILPGGDILAVGSTKFSGPGDIDFWALRLSSSNGMVKWEKAYGGSTYDLIGGAALTPDGHILMTGSTWSFGSGFGDVWVVKVNSTSGDVIWEEAYGSTYGEYGQAVIAMPDGDIVVAGYTCSFGEEENAWVLRLNSDGLIRGCDLRTETGASVEATGASSSSWPISGVFSSASPTVVSSTRTDISTYIDVDAQCWAEVDVAPPEVTITGPTQGVAVRDVITVNVSASDNVGVERVEFYIDDELVFTDYAEPYQYEWDTTGEEEGSHTILAKAYDAEGNVGSDEISVVVDNTAPEITSISQEPSKPVEDEIVLISAQASDATSGISAMTLYYRAGGGPWKSVDMGEVGGVWSATIPGQPAGTTVEYYVVAMDKAGNTATSQIYSYTVAEKPAPAFFGLELWQLLLVVIAILIVALIIVIAKR